MGQRKISRQLNRLLVLLAVALLGAAGWVLARLPLAAPTPPALPERLEWQSDPHSGAVSLILHGMDGKAAGALLPLPIDSPLFPGLSKVWRELADVLQSAPLPEQRDGFDGLQMFNVERLPGTVPSVMQSIPGMPLNAAVRGQQLWLACSMSGLSVLELGEPTKPALRMEWPATWVNLAAFGGNLAFLMDSRGRLEIVELAASGRERLVTRHSLHQKDVEFLGLAVHQGRLLLLKRNARTRQQFLSSCRLDPASQIQLKFTDVPLPIAIASGCWWRDDRLYIAADQGNLIGVDVGDPLQPRIFLKTRLPAKIENLVCSGRTCLVNLVDGRVYAFAVGLPGERQGFARNLGQLPGGFPVWLVFASGRSYAFSHQRGLEVFQSLPMVLNSRQTALSSAPRGKAEAAPPEKFWPNHVLQAAATPTGSVILEDGGRVKLINRVNSHQPTVAAIETGEMSRWMARRNDRIYVGGGSAVTVLRAGESGQLVRTGEVSIPGGESFDAVVFDDMLCVAAGRQGLVTLSLADPDRPVASAVRQSSVLLHQRSDVRSLAAHGRHLFVAGGAAGILKMTIDRDHELAIVGIRPSTDPVHVVAATGSLLLAATKTTVDVLAMAPEERADDLQLLGTLPLKNVKRFALLDQAQFGVRQAVGGWQFLALPALSPFQAGTPPRLILPDSIKPGNYRLLLYNRVGVTEWPTVLSVPARASAGGHKQ